MDPNSVQKFIKGCKIPLGKIKRPEVIVLGIRPYLPHEKPDYFTKQFVKELEANGYRIRSLDPRTYRHRGIYFLPSIYHQTTAAIGYLSNLYQSLVWVLRGTERIRAPFFDGTEHKVFVDKIPVQIDWSN